jgi:hypothetical protein
VCASSDLRIDGLSRILIASYQIRFHPVIRGRPFDGSRHMNTDYVIQIKTKRDRRWSYVKKNNGWSQTAPTGVVRQLTGVQLLSHLLPPLSGDQPDLSVTMERKLATKKKTPNPQRPTPNEKNRLNRASPHRKKKAAVEP